MESWCTDSYHGHHQLQTEKLVYTSSIGWPAIKAIKPSASEQILKLLLKSSMCIFKRKYVGYISTIYLYDKVKRTINRFKINQLHKLI